jgi:hypothetical protein
MVITSRPLLAVDGDSFAHRAYHAFAEVDPPARHGCYAMLTSLSRLPMLRRGSCC